MPIAPLVLTRDASLAEEVTRLAAAAGTDVRVVTEPVAGLVAWSAAPVVLVGRDVAPEVEQVRPPRRQGVHVVGWSGMADEVFRAAVGIGAETVLELPGSAAWLGEVLARAGESSAGGVVLGVVGGCGGAGATTLAAAVAQEAARGGPTLLVDTDPLGPGVDRLFGLESTPGVRWEALEQTSGRLASASLREAVPTVGRLGVLTWEAAVPRPLQPVAAREALAAGRRGHGLVVVDLDRHAGELSAELGARCDLLAVVCPATVAGVAATTRLLARHVGVPAVLVVRPGGVPVADVEQATSLRAVTELGDQRRLSEALDLGLGPVRTRRGPLARAARDLLSVLAESAPTGGRAAA